MAWARFNVENFPTGIDNTQRRLIAYGTVNIMPDTPGGNVYTYEGGLRAVFQPLEPLKAVPVMPNWVEIKRSMTAQSFMYSLYYEWDPGIKMFSTFNKSSTDISFHLYNPFIYPSNGDAVRFEGITQTPYTILNGVTLTINNPPGHDYDIYYEHPFPPPLDQLPNGGVSMRGRVHLVSWANPLPGAGPFSTQMQGMMKIIDDVEGKELNGNLNSGNSAYILHDVIRFRAEFMRSYQ